MNATRLFIKYLCQDKKDYKLDTGRYRSAFQMKDKRVQGMSLAKSKKNRVNKINREGHSEMGVHSHKYYSNSCPLYHYPSPTTPVLQTGKGGTFQLQVFLTQDWGTNHILSAPPLHLDYFQTILPQIIAIRTNSTVISL